MRKPEEGLKYMHKNLGKQGNIGLALKNGRNHILKNPIAAVSQGGDFRSFLIKALKNERSTDFENRGWNSLCVADFF